MAGNRTEDIAYMADWENSLCRKILGYRTPEGLFEAEMDRIYALWRPRRVWFFKRVPPLLPEKPDASAGIVTYKKLLEFAIAIRGY